MAITPVSMMNYQCSRKNTSGNNVSKSNMSFGIGLCGAARPKIPEAYLGKIFTDIQNMPNGSSLTDEIIKTIKNIFAGKETVKTEPSTSFSLLTDASDNITNLSRRTTQTSGLTVLGGKSSQMLNTYIGSYDTTKSIQFVTVNGQTKIVKGQIKCSPYRIFEQYFC